MRAAQPLPLASSSRTPGERGEGPGLHCTSMQDIDPRLTGLRYRLLRTRFLIPRCRTVHDGEEAVSQIRRLTPHQTSFGTTPTCISIVQRNRRTLSWKDGEKAALLKLLSSIAPPGRR